MSRILERLSQVGTVLTGLSALVVAGVVVRDRVLLGKPASEELEVANWAEYAGVGHQTGSKNAKVTVIEFGDYQCPVCRRFAPVLDSVLQKYGDRISFVYRHWPLSIHDRAYPAARAAECANDQGYFWGFHKELYATNSWIEGGFVDIAEKAGIPDLASFETCVSSVEPVEGIERDVLAARAIGGRGTPTILINETMLQGARDFASISELIDSKAPSLVAAHDNLPRCGRC
jgi:protein-disulfide isomerase